jgi:hypothetical protein
MPKKNRTGWSEIGFSLAISGPIDQGRQRVVSEKIKKDKRLKTYLNLKLNLFSS